MGPSGWGPFLGEHFTIAAAAFLIVFQLYCPTVEAISKPFVNSSMPELRPTFFVNFDMSTVICQHSEDANDLHLHEISILCDGQKDCFDNPALHDESFPYCEKKCNSTCNGRGACLYDGKEPQCFCNQGFSGPACEIIDVNECSTRPCHWLAHCQNTVGSFECQCYPGFEGDGFQCSDIDECENGMAACPPNSECINLPGAHFCNCTQGFAPKGSPLERCEDIDECARGIFQCASDELCENTIGGYKCVKQCDQGYRRHEGKCVDVDECSSEKSPCHPRASCLNTDGGYQCSCERGFTGDGKICEPVNIDCRNNKNLCHRHAYCVKGLGLCVCNTGYMGTDGFVCEDINECEANPNSCSDDQRCLNIVGGFLCCDPSTDDERCIKDQAAYCPGGCGKNAACKDEKCQCLSGYAGDPNHECHDVNECDKDDLCKGVGEWCINLQGSYFCCDAKKDSRFCNKGDPLGISFSKDEETISLDRSSSANGGFSQYESGGQKSSSSGGFVEEYEPEKIELNCTSYCPPLSECLNGKCACVKGYEGDPSQGCTDIDECDLKIDDCNESLTQKWCLNEPGGYRCCSTEDKVNCFGLILSKDGFEYSRKESGEVSGNALLLSNATIEEGDIESGDSEQNGQKASSGQTLVESGQKKESSSGGLVSVIEGQGGNGNGNGEEADLSKPAEGELGLIITPDGFQANFTSKEELENLMTTLSGAATSLETTTLTLALSTASQRGITPTGVPISTIDVVKTTQRPELTTKSSKVEVSTWSSRQSEHFESSTSSSGKSVIHKEGSSSNHSSGGSIKVIDENSGELKINIHEEKTTPPTDTKPQPGEVGIEISSTKTKPPKITVDGEGEQSEETNDKRHSSKSTTLPPVTDDNDLLKPEPGETGLEITAHGFSTSQPQPTTSQPDLVLTASPTKPSASTEKATTVSSKASASTVTSSTSSTLTPQSSAGPEIAIDSGEEGDVSGKDGKITKPGKIIVSIGPNKETTAQPTTTQPKATQPTTTQPTTAQPTTAQPTTTTTQPTATQPTTAQPTTTQPTTAQPTTAQPTTAQPTTAQPTTAQPTTAQPTTTTAKKTTASSTLAAGSKPTETTAPEENTKVTTTSLKPTTAKPQPTPSTISQETTSTSTPSVKSTSEEPKATTLSPETSTNAAIEKTTQEATVSPAVVELTSKVTTVSLPVSSSSPTTTEKGVETSKPGVSKETLSTKAPLKETTEIHVTSKIQKNTDATTASPETTTEIGLKITTDVSSKMTDLPEITASKGPSSTQSTVNPSKTTSTTSSTSTSLPSKQPIQKITFSATEKPLIATVTTPQSTQPPSVSPKTEGTTTQNIHGPFGRSESPDVSESTQVPLVVTTLQETQRPFTETVTTSSTPQPIPAEATIVPKFVCISSDSCGIDAYCERRSGGCRCHPGFAGNPPEVNCIDVNECLEGTHNCHETARCHNFVGSYKCFCPVGYRQQPDGSCQDINECHESAGGCCSGNATCVNSPGTYECQCNDGYVGDGYKCIPSQKRACTEEENLTSGCGSNNLCIIDDYGKKDCNECKSGFEMRAGTCVDVDECADQNLNMCSRFALCINTVGTYMCKCHSGFKGDGYMCEDIDECATKPCHANGECQNTEGSFTCRCYEGWIGDGKTACINPSNRECEDLVGTCGTSEHMTCLSARIANGTVQSVCECEANYRWNAVTKKCEDIDECLEDRHDCDPSNSHCKNIPGGYECECMDGYEGRGGVCVDVDECKMGTSGCHHMAMCINRAGSCGCQCMHGYTGDGTKCLVMPRNETTTLATEKPTKTTQKPTVSIKAETKTTKIFERPTTTVNDVTSEEERQCPENWIRNCSLYNKKCEVDLEENPQCSSCISGYQPSINETCIPINGKGPCTPTSCDPHADCREISETNQHRCICRIGFIGDGRKCDGPNCLIDEGLCHPYAKCSTMNGTCVCLDGFEGDGIKMCRSLHLSTKSSTKQTHSTITELKNTSSNGFVTKVTIEWGTKSSTTKAPVTLSKENLPILKTTDQYTKAPFTATIRTTSTGTTTKENKLDLTTRTTNPMNTTSSVVTLVTKVNPNHFNETPSTEILPQSSTATINKVTTSQPSTTGSKSTSISTESTTSTNLRTNPIESSTTEKPVASSELTTIEKHLTEPVETTTIFVTNRFSSSSPSLSSAPTTERSFTSTTKFLTTSIKNEQETSTSSTTNSISVGIHKNQTQSITSEKPTKSTSTTAESTTTSSNLPRHESKDTTTSTPVTTSLTPTTSMHRSTKENIPVETTTSVRQSAKPSTSTETLKVTLPTESVSTKTFSTVTTTRATSTTGIPTTTTISETTTTSTTTLTSTTTVSTPKTTTSIRAKTATTTKTSTAMPSTKTITQLLTTANRFEHTTEIPTTTVSQKTHSIVQIITGIPEEPSGTKTPPKFSLLPHLITGSAPTVFTTKSTSPPIVSTSKFPNNDRTTSSNSHKDGINVNPDSTATTRHHFGTVLPGCETRPPNPRPPISRATTPQPSIGAISGAKRCTADDRSACHALALCETDGVCRCKNGYEGDGYQSCKKTTTIDCVEDPTICDLRAQCNEARRRCQCTIGYIGDGIICAPDPQDCVIRHNLCSAEALCVGRRCQCQPGYTGDGVVCVSIHERGTNASACVQNAHFDGTLCKCNVGYLGNGLCCVPDPRDCTHFPGVCHSNAFCQKEERTCKCNHGYQGNGFSCLALRSCRTTPTLCHRDAVCSPNGDCFCKEGYVGDGFTCKRRGFIGQRESQVSDTPSACGNLCNEETELCINAKCECKHGFERLGGVCTDVNECVIDKPCHQLASCNNLDGSYECTCPDGYHGDGKSCVENVKLGELQVLCEPGQMTLLLENGTELNDGRIFVRGQSENPHCTKQFSAFHREAKPYRFIVPFEHCNVRMEEKDTIAVTVVVQKHPMFITARSDAYDLRCTYPIGNREVESHVNVSDVAPSLTLSDESAGPLCTLVVTNEQEEMVNSAMVGQSLHLTLSVEPSESYSILPKNCFAINIETGERYSLTDRWGCAIDAELFPEWTRVRPSKTQALFRTFKWPDSSMIRFQCDCSACVGDCAHVDCERRRQIAQRLFRFRRARNTPNRLESDTEDLMMTNEALMEHTEEEKLGQNLVSSARIAFSRLIAVHEKNQHSESSPPRGEEPKSEVLRESTDDDRVCVRTAILAASTLLFILCLSTLIFLALRHRRKSLVEYPSLPSLS